MPSITDQPVNAPCPVLDTPDDVEISPSALLKALSKEKRRIFRVVILTAVIATPAVFLLPVKYRAEAVILTPQQGQSSLSAMAQIAGAGQGLNLSALGLLSGFGLRNPSELYIGILESRTIADSLIERFKLKQVYHEKYLVTARKNLERNTTIKSGKDSLIHIQVEDKNPNRAADLANAYVDELSKHNAKLALTEASERRVFFESQLFREKEALADAEVALQNTQQATGLVAPAGQAEALLRAGAQLRAEILGRQAQLAAMSTYAADSNPRLQILKREVGALQAEFNDFQRGEHKTGTLELPTGELPEAGLKYVRKLREVKYHEALFEILAKQYEAARLDEAKSAPLVQVVDQAVIPEKRSWPPRTILVLGATLLAGLISCFRVARRANLVSGRS
ncbi:MAG TPA: Wzz/FepE/Etk N-terminal domain-containing protein [Bryobacteraceae bacterium]|nr:Wzz/FepE/Etk N-terminal domain-containing protein [Bryobacteraceae bacterium]